MKKFLLALFVSSMSLAYGQTIVYPSDTLVDPSLFSNSNILMNWELGLCPVKANNGDTTYAPCYTVTYRDHYKTSITLCPPNLDSVGGMGLFNGTPRLLDSSLFVDMEADGSNIIANDDSYSINYNNLTTSTKTDGGGVNPKYCIEADLFLGDANATWYHTFQILLGPTTKPGGSINYHTAETIGILKNGLVLEHTPPSSESVVAQEGGIIPIDHCGWHPEPFGFGHFHAVPTGINAALAANGIAAKYHCKDIDQENDRGLAGFTFEGIPIYGPLESDGSTPTGLDGCYGHTGATNEFPGGVYHYHISATDIINNPPCRSYYAPLEDTRFTYGEWISTDVNTAPMKEYAQLSVYPTLVKNGSLIIEGAHDGFSIFDVNGAVVMQAAASNEAQTKVDIAHLSDGIYFISATKDNALLYERIVVQQQ